MANLKRKRGDIEDFVARAADLPPLPELSADHLLAVFTHPSLVGVSNNAKYIDRGMLALKLSVTTLLWARSPPLSIADIKACLSIIMRT